LKLRVALCGGRELASAAEALGLIPVEAATAALAVIDLRESGSVVEAAALPAELPRVVVGDEAQIQLAGALGMPTRSVARSCEPAALGPLIAATVPATRRQATRSVLVTSVRGGVGRSLLAANLARRLAPTRSTLALDVTGGGALAWWLGSTAATWADLEGLTDELSAEHLGVVATETAPGLRVVGGPPAAPSTSLTRSALRAALELSEIVIVDAPPLADERTRQLVGVVDRVLVLSYDDPVSIATLAAADIPEGAWLVASQSTAASLSGRDVFRALPRAEAAIAAAASRPSAVGGALGKAYQELAEIVAIDST
jgi:Mrp family chromosome partitioning ATPase